jgi:hypothetical protein
LDSGVADQTRARVSITEQKKDEVMSLFSFLGFGRKGRGALSRSPEKRLYIVDATGMVDNRARNGNIPPSPRDHYMVLRNLAQFAGRERINMVAVFIGRPLREAADGAEYKGVKVYYADNSDTQANKIVRLARENVGSRDVIMITADADIESEAVTLNAACMRPATLKKALDDREDHGDRGDHRDNDSRPQRYGRSRQPQQDRRQERQPEQDRGSESARPQEASQRPQSQANAPAPANDDKDKPEPGVLDLIDPM